VSLNIADGSILLFSGSGTYFGLIFVLRRSLPTIDVPLGMITPPRTLFNLNSSLSGDVKSKLLPNPNGLSIWFVCPNLVVYLAFPLTSTGMNPGLLSTVCVPAARIMVVKSNLSFLCPTT